jgi:hypothetical protein
MGVFPSFLSLGFFFIRKAGTGHFEASLGFFFSKIGGVDIDILT